MDSPVQITNHTHYHSYLLRLWRAGEKGAPALRIVLVSPHTGERWSFHSLEAMAAFLDHQFLGEAAEDLPKSTPNS